MSEMLQRQTGEGMGAERAEQVRDASSAVEHVAVCLDDLDNALAMLAERIEKALVPPTPELAKTLEVPAQQSRVRDLADRVLEIRRAVEAITERVDL